MEYDPIAKEIKLEKVLNELDKLVIDFTELLDEYVIVSGYVSILLGRSRASEDIDLLLPYLEKNHFIQLFEKFYENDFECLNISNAEEAFDLLQKHAIRFAKKGQPLPNIEFKIIKTELDKFSYDNRIKVIVNFHVLYISPLELQIAFKLYLGSEKDIEDARHLYKTFKEKINKEELLYSLEKLNVFEKMRLLENGKH